MKIVNCVVCNKEVLKKSFNQKYCAECAVERKRKKCPFMSDYERQKLFYDIDKVLDRIIDEKKIKIKI